MLTDRGEQVEHVLLHRAGGQAQLLDARRRERRVVRILDVQVRGERPAATSNLSEAPLENRVVLGIV